MTGTPVENHLGELWSLFEFLNPGHAGQFQGVPRHLEEHRARRRKPGHVAAGTGSLFILRRTKERVLAELPEKTEQTLHCDLEGQQRKQYDELRDYYRSSLSKRIAAGGLANAKIHVLECCSACGRRLSIPVCWPGRIAIGRAASWT